MYTIKKKLKKQEAKKDLNNNIIIKMKYLFLKMK